MVTYFAYLVLLLVNPVLALLVNGRASGLLIFVVSYWVLHKMRTNVRSNPQIVYSFTTLNHILLVYCLYNSNTQLIFVVPEAHLYIPSDDGNRVNPFVSIVLVDSPNGTSCMNYNESVDALLKSASPILTREIVAPLYNESVSGSGSAVVSGLSVDSDMVIYVSCCVELVDGWMNGIVRELFSHPHHMIVPTLYLFPNNPFASGAMISSASGMWLHINPGQTEWDVPLIPRFSVLGMSRSLVREITHPRILRLLAENRLVELSLMAWFCHGGVRSTGFSKVVLLEKTPPLHDWKSIEGETVDEEVIASCNSKRDMEWFFDRFARYDPETPIKVFEVQVGLRRSDGSRMCLIANLNGTLGASLCDRRNPQLAFVIPPGDTPAIKSIGIPNNCLDTNSVYSVGSRPILYSCTERNRNQMFYLDGTNIRWGSFCLTADESGEITLDACTGSATQIFYAENY
jgi:hypothetical protein